MNEIESRGKSTPPLPLSSTNVSLNTQLNYADLLNGQFPTSHPGLIRFSNPNLVQHFQLVQRPMLLTRNPHDPIQQQQHQHQQQQGPNNTANLLRQLNIIQSQNNSFQHINETQEKAAAAAAMAMVNDQMNAAAAMLNATNHHHHHQNFHHQQSNAPTSLMQLQNFNSAIQMRFAAPPPSHATVIPLNQQHFQSQQNMNNFIQQPTPNNEMLKNNGIDIVDIS